MEAARDLVLRGVGAGFFTRTYVADALVAGSLVEVAVRDLPPLQRDAALVRRNRAVLSPASAALAESLRVQAAALGLLRPGRPERRGDRRTRDS
jgi:DNA-binding transcriptional LysR family regulator